MVLGSSHGSTWEAQEDGLGRLKRMGFHCHQLPAMAVGPWVPQPFQALMAYSQILVRLARRNVNFRQHLLHSRECVYFRSTMCLSFQNKNVSRLWVCGELPKT